MVPGEAARDDAGLVGFRAHHRRHRVSLRRHLPYGQRRRRRCLIRSCACAASSGCGVIDASVMPQITSANTNATSLMIGERGAALVMA